MLFRSNIFAGQYHSAFKGRGMAFSEVREYQYGDDGVDMFLLDDGWFGNKYKRSSDTAGLGDWGSANATTVSKR